LWSKGLKPQDIVLNMSHSSANIARHKALCKVCNSPNCKEIEAKYLRWTSPYDLEVDYPEVTADNVYNHVLFFGLNIERDKDHDKLLAAIIEKGFVKGLKITDAVIARAVEMRMKKRGDMPLEGGLNLTFNLKELQDNRLKNQRLGLEKFGVKVPALEEVEIVEKDNGEPNDS
jgi:hypothetical protein